MIPELFFLPAADLATNPELPPLPRWFTLSLAGAFTLVAALVVTLG